MGKQSIGTAEFPFHSSISCIGFWKEVNSLLLNTKKVAVTFRAPQTLFFFKDWPLFQKMWRGATQEPVIKIFRPHFGGDDTMLPLWRCTVHTTHSLQPSREPQWVAFCQRRNLEEIRHQHFLHHKTLSHFHNITVSFTGNTVLSLTRISGFQQGLHHHTYRHFTQFNFTLWSII